MNQYPQAGAQDNLTRPSLFATSMEGESTDVKSSPRSLLPAHGLHKVLPTQAASAGSEVWRWRALVALLCAGVLALLYSFVQVVSHPHARPELAQATPSTATSPTPSTPNALAPTLAVERIVSAAPTSAGTAATIETMASVRTPDRSADNQALSASSAPTIADAATWPKPTQRKQPRPDTPSDAPPYAINNQAEAPKSKRTPARRSDDVGLIEVVMTHASGRRIPPSAQESLSECAALPEPDASACQAKACSLHPSASQCLDKAP